MKNTSIVLAFVCGILFCCSTSKTSLPAIFTCEDPLQIMIDSSMNNYLKGTKLDTFDYRGSYAMIFGHQDSIQKQGIREKLSGLTNLHFKQNFPQTTKLDDSLLLSLDYNELMSETVNISYGQPSHLKDLVGSNTYKNELLLVIRCYISKHIPFKISASFIVYNNTNIPVYYDLLTYHCDCRDEKSLRKVLSFGFQRIKENSE